MNEPDQAGRLDGVETRGEGEGLKRVGELR